jgi:hypothetical protein
MPAAGVQVPIGSTVSSTGAIVPISTTSGGGSSKTTSLTTAQQTIATNLNANNPTEASNIITRVEAGKTDPNSMYFGKTDAQILADQKAGFAQTAVNTQVQAEINALAKIPGTQYYDLTHPAIVTTNTGQVVERYNLGGGTLVDLNPKTAEVISSMSNIGGGMLVTTDVSKMTLADVQNLTAPILKANNMLSFIGGGTGTPRDLASTMPAFGSGLPTRITMPTFTYPQPVSKKIDTALKGEMAAYTGISTGFTNKSQLGQANFQQMGSGSYRGYEGGKVTKNPFKQFTFNSKELRI